MATSPSLASSTSPANSRHGSSLQPGDPDGHLDHGAAATASVAVETLVEHLLAAKRSLSSMTLVLRANDLSTHARQLYEESAILGAQTAFLKKGINDQTKLLLRVRRNMIRTYDAGKREFKHIIKTLDAANGKLENTIDMLRHTTVDPVFRPSGEEPKNLLDFVDENQVHAMRDALKCSIAELQATQTSFDGDLFRFDNDLRALSKILKPSTTQSPPKSPADSTTHQQHNLPILDILASLTDHSHSMAEHLTSLTRHFDMCVTAVRITEGGAALARRKAAEDATSADPVSISGVIAEQESNVSELEPEGKIEIVQVVMQDAPEVDEVVADLNTEMQLMEMDFAQLKEQTDQTRSAYVAVTQAFQILEEIGSRLTGYIAAETEFLDRWGAEKQSIFARLEEMETLRDFYEGYGSAYDSLILEVERRRAVEEKIQGIWRKAKEQVDKLVESDWRDREMFRAEVGDYIPTDLWVGMSGPLKRWEVVRAGEGEGSGHASVHGSEEAMPRQEDGSAVELSREVVDAARERIRMSMSGGK
ncbi:Autophagy-related protein 17 [Cytospora mali]|uniref:Autophagy-related protein 17 n=1 Tax=Cytospora mali TaxID=578113 RepID=A0A194V5U5_CYTMA|nr:Autophagy-related protein 17 [Valsa mali var. pyri (nom. inval.)]